MPRISYKQIIKSPLLISLCIHATAFMLLGFIVFGDMPIPKEPVNVELVVMKQIRMQRLRPSMPGIRKLVSVASEPTNNLQTTAVLLTKQLAEQSYITTEESSSYQYKPVNILGNIYPEKATVRFLLSTPGPEISPPKIRKMQIVPFGMDNHLPASSALYDLIAPSIGETPDPEILQDFLQMISKKIEKSKRYPRWAMEMELEGKVVVKFIIHQNGNLDPDIQITNSSGTEILDKAAIAAIKNASPFPNLPNELKREYIQIELPMSFKLGG